MSDLWEDVSLSTKFPWQKADINEALRATYSSGVPPETRMGFLNRFEFFVLLAELQAKLGVSEEAFSNIFLQEKRCSGPRRNPFAKSAFTENATPSMESDSARGVESIETKALEDSTEHVEIQVSLPSKQPALADGYSEYVKTFGAPVLAAPPSPTPPERVNPSSTLLQVTEEDKEAIPKLEALTSVAQEGPSLEAASSVQRNELSQSAGTKSG